MSDPSNGKDLHFWQFVHKRVGDFGMTLLHNQSPSGFVKGCLCRWKVQTVLLKTTWQNLVLLLKLPLFR